MSAVRSPSTDRVYGVQRVCRSWGLSRSTFYDRKARKASDVPGKRGPRTLLSDAELVEQIRGQLRDTEEQWGIRGEGHRKVWARLRHAGVRTSKRRVLRFMCEHGLLARRRSRRPRGPYVHDGTITTVLPDQMWGTDASMTWTRQEGYVWVFIAVDHCNSELVGVHASKSGSRFEALEPVKQGLREHFGPLERDVAAGLQLRHDHGPQYMSNVFQDEIDFFGVESSPAFVASPEGNGVAERFFRTLKEKLLWVETFETVQDLEPALQAFREIYNEQWLVARHGYSSPAQVRRELTGSVAA
ncbi:MAG TPA: integrase core domain-containing protein [Myxococcota bacterium]|nr:integrase core domain-containing protein [Myxococcota bacterium]